MKATLIYPKDLGCTQYCDEWFKFIGKFGHVTTMPSILLTEIEIRD